MPPPPHPPAPIPAGKERHERHPQRVPAEPDQCEAEAPHDKWEIPELGRPQAGGISPLGWRSDVPADLACNLVRITEDEQPSSDESESDEHHHDLAASRPRPL